jgi:glyoxylase-like metal-dependent hydrolase (beta-lactamase superfamily II)
MNSRSVAGFALLTLLSLSSPAARSQETAGLPNFLPVPASVKARILEIDPQKGYLVKELKPNVYMITDGAYQSLFITTGRGVIVIDAPPSFGSKIVQAIGEVTKEPIKELVYSHSHLDHISGAVPVMKEVPGLEILAEEGVAAFLSEKNDPRRPVPTRTFKDHYVVEMGSARIELKKGHWHSNEGDLFIYLPAAKVLMAVDTMPPGSAPFMDFDLTDNFREYLKMFDELLAYDFDVLIGGHLSFPGTRNDVQVTKEYTTDVYKTVKRIHDSTNQMKVVAEAASRYGWDNKMALFKALLDPMIQQCAQEIVDRWSDKLASVDVYAASHCHTALIYARWDD